MFNYTNTAEKVFKKSKLQFLTKFWEMSQNCMATVKPVFMHYVLRTCSMHTSNIYVYHIISINTAITIQHHVTSTMSTIVGRIYCIIWKFLYLCQGEVQQINRKSCYGFKHHIYINLFTILLHMQLAIKYLFCWFLDYYDVESYY